MCKPCFCDIIYAVKSIWRSRRPCGACGSFSFSGIAVGICEVERADDDRSRGVVITVSAGLVITITVGADEVPTGVPELSEVATGIRADGLTPVL